MQGRSVPLYEAAFPFPSGDAWVVSSCGYYRECHCGEPGVRVLPLCEEAALSAHGVRELRLLFSVRWAVGAALTGTRPFQVERSRPAQAARFRCDRPLAPGEQSVRMTTPVWDFIGFSLFTSWTGVGDEA